MLAGGASSRRGSHNILLWNGMNAAEKFESIFRKADD
jgi:hypothetical protein